MISVSVPSLWTNSTYLRPQARIKSHVKVIPVSVPHLWTIWTYLKPQTRRKSDVKVIPVSLPSLWTNSTYLRPQGRRKSHVKVIPIPAPPLWTNSTYLKPQARTESEGSDDLITLPNFAAGQGWEVCSKQRSPCYLHSDQRQGQDFSRVLDLLVCRVLTHLPSL